MAITAVGARGNEINVYHKALIYCLGISENTRNHFSDIYDAKSRCINVKCLNHGWQTSGSMKVVRMAYLFCCSYAPFFWQAIQIRYPEYANYDYELHRHLGG